MGKVDISSAVVAEAGVGLLVEADIVARETEVGVGAEAGGGERKRERKRRRSSEIPEISAAVRRAEAGVGAGVRDVAGGAGDAAGPGAGAGAVRTSGKTTRLMAVLSRSV
jgi:hypothetical protein